VGQAPSLFVGVVRGRHCARREWGGCALVTMAAAGGSLSVCGRLCALVVVVGRVVSWWVLAAVHGYGVGGWS
jgi:hypothetical protein